MSINPQQFGKYLILAGLIIAVVGALVFLLGYLGVFRLPGDIQIKHKNFRIYLPLASCIVLSVLLTLLLWLINYFRR